MTDVEVAMRESGLIDPLPGTHQAIIKTEIERLRSRIVELEKECSSPILVNVARLADQLSTARSQVETLRESVDRFVMAANLPGNHCEIEQAVIFGKEALATTKPLSFFGIRVKIDASIPPGTVRIENKKESAAIINVTTDPEVHDGPMIEARVYDDGEWTIDGWSGKPHANMLSNFFTVPIISRAEVSRRIKEAADARISTR